MCTIQLRVVIMCEMVLSGMSQMLLAIMAIWRAKAAKARAQPPPGEPLYILAGSRGSQVYYST